MPKRRKNEGVLFILVGLVALTDAAWFMVTAKTPFCTQLSYSLILFTLIQLTVCIFVYLKSPKNIKKVTQMVNHYKLKNVTEEIPRMKTVMKNFIANKWIELVLILIGLITFFSYHPMTFCKGLGLGLIIQTGFILLFDSFAERKEKNYPVYLQTFI